MIIARETVQRYMRRWASPRICPGPEPEQPHAGAQVYPYLLPERHARLYPNHMWGIDITYIRLPGGWLYLVAVIDWFSRYVVSWELDQTLEMPFVVGAVGASLGPDDACDLEQRSGQSFHQSAVHPALLLAAGVQISMDGKGGRATTSSPSGSGARSSMKKST